jgi:hypothetical protein
MRLLVIAVVIGALLDVGVFAYQLSLNSMENRSIARGDCWFAILDRAVTRDHISHQLVIDARRCVRLPHP